MSERCDKKIGRRGFLKRAGLSAIGIGIGSGTLQRVVSSGTPEPEVKLPRVTLGRTKLKVSRMGVGGGQANVECVEAAIDRGINLIHTAPNYSGGKTVEAYRQVFEHGHRDKVILAYKGVVELPNKKPAPLQVQVDEGLKRFGTDHIDILLCNCHNVDIVSAAWIKEEFDKIKAQGKVRFLGFACHKFMPQVLTKAAEVGWYDVALVAFREPSDEFFAAVKKVRDSGMGLIAMKGITPEVRKNAAATRAASVKILKEHGAHSLMMVMDTMEKVEMYAEIASLPEITPAEEKALQQARMKESGKVCLMCGSCSVCPRGVEVAEMMRFKMYYEDYGYRDMAREGYGLLSRQQRAENCDGCGLCEEVCHGGLPIRDLIASAGRILA